MPQIQKLTLNGTITQGKTRELLNVDSDVAGIHEIYFTNEAEALKLSINVLNLGGITVGAWRVFEIGGDSANHKRLVFSSPNNGARGVYESTHLSTGRILVEVTYTGEAQFELSATGISALAAAPVQDVNVLPDQHTIDYRTDQLYYLKQISKTLKMVNNHLRLITGVEKDRGRDF